MTPSGILGVQYRIQGVQQENVNTFTNYELRSCMSFANLEHSIKVMRTFHILQQVCSLRLVLSPSISSRPACKSVSMLVRHWRISWAVPCSVAAWYAGRLLRTCLIISYLLGVHFVCTVWMWAAGLRKKEYCSPDFMQLPTSIASAAKPLSAGNMWVAYLTTKHF